MAYVDDLKPTFDAALFCEQVSAAAGRGRFSSEAALRNPSALPAASAALHKFLALAKSPDPPDVIAAYVAYSPHAAELFHALRTVAVDPSVAAAALECLTQVVRYSLSPESPPAALEAVRYVVRSVVRTHAQLVTDVLLTDRRACARKALELLRLTATCHPLLAKELVNRYDFSSKRLSSTLCSKTNNYCRMPFLDLLFSVITRSNRDVHLSLSVNSRELLITCLSTITQRTVEEANATSPIQLQPSSKPNNSPFQHTALPGYVQKRELVASINFLMALHKHLFDDMPKHVRRKTFAPPLCNMLAKIACTQLPSITVAPRQVQADQRTLRDTAAKLFIAFATDADRYMLRQAGDALLATQVASGSSPAILFAVRVIEQQPQLSRHLLDYGPFLSTPPEPSTKWLSFCSVLSACLMRTSTLPSSISKHSFLEKCLTHSSSIVRHFGHLFTLSFCRIVLQNAKYLETPDAYLPSVDFLRQTLRKEKSGDALVHKLLAQYQLIFSRKVDKRKTILMNVAVSKSADNILEAENSIRSGLKVAPNETVRMVMNHRLFSRLILQACTVKDIKVSQKLWHLCSEVLSHSFLFPSSTKYEVELFLAFASGLGKERQVCIEALEDMFSTALANPYGLYDQLNTLFSLQDDISPPVSLFFIAILLRIRKIKDGNKAVQGMSESEQTVFEKSLIRIAGSIVASMVVLDPVTERNASLMSTVSTFVSTDVFWWSSAAKPAEDNQNQDNVVKACVYLQNELQNIQTYPKTSFFALLSSLCSCILHASFTEHEHIRSRTISQGLEMCWESWQDNKSEGFSWLQNRCSASTTGLETTAVPRFFLQLCCRKGISGLTLEDQLRSLKQSTLKGDYLALLGAVFRTTNCAQIREILLPEFIGELTGDSDESQESRESMFCIGSAIISSIRGENVWDRDSVGVIISTSIRILETCRDNSRSRQKLAFCCSLLHNLTQHRCPSVSVCSYLFLNNVKHLNASFLPSLSVHCSKQLVDLLPHFPALSEALIEHVTTWADGTGLPLPIPILVLVQGLLESKCSPWHSSIGLHKWNLYMLQIAKSLHALTECNGGREEDLRNHVVVETIQKLGEHVISNVAVAKDLLEKFRKVWDMSSSLSKYTWILWHHVFSPERYERLESVAAREIITNLFGLMVDFIADDPHCLTVVPILHVFSRILSFVRFRKCFSFVGGTDQRSIEAKLVTISKSLIRLAANQEDRMNLERSVSPTESVSSDHYELVCTCVSEILGLDMPVHEVAKESIILLCNDKQSLASLVGASALDTPHSNHEGHLFHDPSFIQLCSTTSLLRVALNRIDESHISEEVLCGLLNIEEVFSPFSVYRASTSVSDENIRAIMDRITGIYRVTPEKESALQVRRGYFKVDASSVLSALDKQLLEEACDCLLTSSDEVTQYGDSRNAMDKSTTALDSQFVLQLFLRSCAEALERPSQPILDINHVVREGLLGLILTGLASHEETVRNLSYASMELLSRLIGPIHEKVQSAAASLYKDRKQLAFLIELLRNSITEPMTQCLPLFVVWFRISVNVALKPKHPANKIVTTFLLRSAILDVHDCVGVHHFLHCSAENDELLPTRSLAFEILGKGVRSKRDVIVLKKRRLIDTIFMFGFRKSLFNSSLSFTALKTLSAFIKRDYEVDMAHGLVFTHGIVPWIVQDTFEGNEREQQILTKLEILSNLATAMRGRRDTDKHMTVLSIALKHLGRAAVQQSNHVSSSVLHSLLKCGSNICDMMPELRHSIRLGFSAVYDNSMPSNQKVTDEALTTKFSKCIVRQVNISVSQKTCTMVLRKTILLFSSATDENLESKKLERSMYHAFIAEWFLDRCVRKRDAGIDSNSMELLAKVLYLQPSIWTIVAAYAVLDSCNSIRGSLAALADMLPCAPPDLMRPAAERKYDSVVNDKKIVRTICSKLLSMSYAELKSGDAPCEPKSASSSE